MFIPTRKPAASCTAKGRSPGVVNMSMLVVAATVFFGSGLTNIASLEGAHRTLQPLLGGASSVLFALALTASGLSSSTVGTMSGQVVMQGFIHRQIPIFARRAITMIPALVLIGNETGPRIEKHPDRQGEHAEDEENDCHQDRRTLERRSDGRKKAIKMPMPTNLAVHRLRQEDHTRTHARRSSAALTKSC